MGQANLEYSAVLIRIQRLDENDQLQADLTVADRLDKCQRRSHLDAGQELKNEFAKDAEAESLKACELRRCWRRQGMLDKLGERAAGMR